MAERAFVAKATAASNTNFTVAKGQKFKFHLYPVADLTASEFVDLQAKDPDGNYGDLYDHTFKGSGGQVRLDSTVTAIVVDAEGEYRWAKDTSTNAIGIAVSDVD